MLKWHSFEMTHTILKWECWNDYNSVRMIFSVQMIVLKWYSVWINDTGASVAEWVDQTTWPWLQWLWVIWIISFEEAIQLKSYSDKDSVEIIQC
jgi:hypothetical protein